MSKVLIFTETIGGNGHFRAATAIQKALVQLNPRSEVKLVNGLSLVSRKLEAVIRHTYLHTLRFAPKLWGSAYAQEERLSLLFQAPLGQFLSIYLREIIDRERPDLIVCTHAFCLGAVAQLKKEFDFRLGAAVTDFAVNSFWLHEDVDFYLVAHDDVRETIVQKGYDQSRVVTTGIPIDPLFSQVVHIPKPYVRQRIGVKRDRPTILIMGGGMGLGPIEQVIGYIDDTLYDAVQTIVLTGRNRLLREKCEKLYSDRPNISVFGYVDDCAYYMAASDLLITKPGGLTSSEALALGLPLIITQPIPGHEERNTRFLLDKQLAFYVSNLEDISRYLFPLLEDEALYRQLSDRLRQVGKPSAAHHAAEIILSMV